MKRNRMNAVVLALVLILIAFAAPRAQAQDTGWLPLATQSLSLVSSSATIIGTLPANCTIVTVIASGAQVNYGPSTVNSGTLWPYLTDGEIKTFPPTVLRNPKRYFCIRGTATAAAKLGIIAE